MKLFVVTLWVQNLLFYILVSRNGVFADDVAVEQCTYEDDLGNIWDFSDIKSPSTPLSCDGNSCTTSTARGKIVYANLCKPMSDKESSVCKASSGEQIMAYAKFKNAEKCIQFGVISTSLSPTFSKVDINQLDVTYNGHSCDYSPNRKNSIIYSFHCDNKATATSYALSSSDRCSYNLHIYSPKACATIPSKNLAPFTIFLLVMLGIFLLYCAFGSLYNSQVRGTSGIESIPNVDFWRNFLKYLEDGLLYVYLKATCQQRTIMHESLMQDDQLHNQNFDDSDDNGTDSKLDNVVTHL
eukprot:g4668.t1